MITDASYPSLAAAGCAVAVILFAAGLRRRHLKPVYALPLTAAGLLAAFIAGKLFWIIFNLPQLSLEGPVCLVRLIPAEFSFTGGLAGLSLGIALTARLLKLPVPDVLDGYAVPCCIFAAFIRFAEIFAGDLGLGEMATFGLEEISEGSLLAFFPLAVRDSWGEWLPALSTLEALCALITGAAVLRRGTSAARGKIRFAAGSLFEFALFYLCLCGFFFETAKLSGVIFYYVHVEQLLCALVLLGLLIHICSGRSRREERLPWLPVVLFLLCVALNGLSQFFLDKPWLFSGLIPEAIFTWLTDRLELFCSTVMLLTTVCIGVLYLLAFRKAVSDS